MESKQLPAIVVVPAELQELHRQIEEWRRKRSHRNRMPEALWSLAAHLASEHGLARVARFARLDYYSLKQRLEALERKCAARSDSRPAFIELPPLSAAPVSECIIEVEERRGCRMRIQVKGAPLPDLSALTRSFCGMKP